MSDLIKTSPLNELIGVWKGNMGIDLAPKPKEDENNPYYEVLTIKAVDIDIENAEEQEMTAVMYHQVVREKSNDKVSHSETGYWIWDKNEDTIMCSFSIPRGVSLLAGGSFEKTISGEIKFSVSSNLEHPNWRIVQSPFLEKHAKTLSFKREINLMENTLSYSQETTLDIYGKIFNHKDTNTLKKIE